MWRDHLASAWRNIRQAPYLSMLMVLGLALGVCSILTAAHFVAVIPSVLLPGNPDQLYKVILDNWDRDHHYNWIHLNRTRAFGR
ncbi:MAG: hypothetical protein AAFX99_13675, partial [Myxococcota bacterium]